MHLDSKENELASALGNLQQFCRIPAQYTSCFVMSQQSSNGDCLARLPASKHKMPLSEGGKLTYPGLWHCHFSLQASYPRYTLLHSQHYQIIHRSRRFLAHRRRSQLNPKGSALLGHTARRAHPSRFRPARRIHDPTRHSRRCSLPPNRHAPSRHHLRWTKCQCARCRAESTPPAYDGGDKNEVAVLQHDVHDHLTLCPDVGRHRAGRLSPNPCL